MACSKLLYWSVPGVTGPPRPPATVAQATKRVPSQIQFTAALAMPALAAANAATSSSDTMRPMVITAPGALTVAWVAVSGSNAPDEAVGLVTAVTPDGQTSR